MRDANFDALKIILNTEAARLEATPYGDLNRPGKEWSYTHTVEGRDYSLCVEVIATGTDGTLEILVDIAAGHLPTLLGVKPALHFFKHPDGSVSY